MLGKTCLITGANAGIGKAAAIGLARQGARVVLLCRNEARGRAAMDEIERQTGSGSLDLLVADLASQMQIRAAAAEYLQRFDRLDVLMNNAAVLAWRERRLNEDGLEMTFAVNHLAPFLLTGLLLGRLEECAPSRIVTVASGAHRRTELDFDDLQNERAYSPFDAYSRSKLANVYFTYELARRLEGTGVTANCLHPGVVSTALFREMRPWQRVALWLGRPFLLKPESGSDTAVYLASAPEIEGVTGQYFEKRKQVPSSPVSYDSDIARRLWEVSEALTSSTAG
ncbi:MAG: SDR family oxidoreductase [Alphaproteobacteria bacterium]|nr:SDR family oxidoreductase [Alphaproteobacteria bacterium]